MLDLTLLLQAFFATLLYLIVTRIYRGLTGPLRGLPGPTVARFTKLWYFRCTLQNDFRWKNIDLHRKFGPIVRLAPNQYSLDDPNAAKQMYSTGTSFVKSEWYDFWKNPDPHAFQDIFSLRDPSKHAHNRKVVSCLYSMSNLVQMESCVDETIDLLLEKLDEFAYSNETFDLLHWMRCYAFDVVLYITVR